MELLEVAETVRDYRTTYLSSELSEYSLFVSFEIVQIFAEDSHYDGRVDLFILMYYDISELGHFSHRCAQLFAYDFIFLQHNKGVGITG